MREAEAAADREREEARREKAKAAAVKLEAFKEMLAGRIAAGEINALTS